MRPYLDSRLIAPDAKDYAGRVRLQLAASITGQCAQSIQGSYSEKKLLCFCFTNTPWISGHSNDRRFLFLVKGDR